MNCFKFNKLIKKNEMDNALRFKKKTKGHDAKSNLINNLIH